MDDKPKQIDKFENYEFPKDRKYLVDDTPNHFWVKIENGNQIILGLSDFFQKRIGELKSFKNMDKVGKTVILGKTLAVIKAKNYSSVLRHKIAGQILELNDLNKNPKLINKSPYEDGWIIKFKLESSLMDLLEGNWVELTKEGESKFKEFIDLEIKNNALLPDDCCPDFLGGSGVVRRRKK